MQRKFHLPNLFGLQNYVFFSRRTKKIIFYLEKQKKSIIFAARISFEKKTTPCGEKPQILSPA